MREDGAKGTPALTSLPRVSDRRRIPHPEQTQRFEIRIDMLSDVRRADVEELFYDSLYVVAAVFILLTFWLPLAAVLYGLLT
jgi:hypothetical protein